MSALLSFALSPSRGFHSTLSTRIALNDAPPGCSTLVLYTLPPSIIVDRYELSDRDIAFELWGESNLELPVFAVNQSDVVLLLDVKPASNLQEAVVDVPVHVRYGPPHSGDTHQSIEVPPPMCFWACPRSGTLHRLPTFPIVSDAVAVDASSPFTPSPLIDSSNMLRPFGHFLVPETAPLLSAAKLEIPVGSVHDLPLVEAGTATVVVLAFLWLLYRSWTCANKLHAQHFKQQ
ncbi:PIG-X [Scleroderma citrinum]